MHAGHFGDGRGAEDADAVELPAPEQHAAETGEIGGRGEESGVTGDAVHGARSGVMHDPAQHRAGGEFGGCDAVELGSGGAKPGVAEAKGQKNFFCRIGVEGQTAGDPHELTEYDEVDVAVEKRAAGHADEFLRASTLDGGGVTGPSRRSRKAGAQAGVVGEKLADGDRIFAVGGERGQVSGDGRVKFEAAALDQLHDGSGGGDHLGERGGVVDRIGGERLGGGHYRALAVGAGVGLAGAFDPEDAAGNLIGRDGVGHRGIHGREFLGQKCGRSGGGGYRDKCKQGREQAKEG